MNCLRKILTEEVFRHSRYFSLEQVGILVPNVSRPVVLHRLLIDNLFSHKMIFIFILIERITLNSDCIVDFVLIHRIRKTIHDSEIKQ